uniref:RCC1-like domain-containing protein n=1 Tax=Globisporangium ultimum (strain ATCC 200006 / CBS 805.95 / DAOM BR144) TaxID=431595 RepID=K3W6X4_GLOUD
MPSEQHATDCAVVAFGCNDDGQLGRGEKRRLTGPIDDVSPAHFPQQIEEIFALDIAAVSCGSRHTMVLTTQGEVYSWGWGSMGQLGHGDLKSSNFPRKIEFFATQGLVVEYISCGGCHSAAVTKDGAVYTWGEAHWGQLGLPKEFSDLHQSLPAKCPILQDGSEEKVVKISCGGAHMAALTDKGHVYMWGRCDNGQLGIGQAWLHDSDCEGLLGVSHPHRVEGFGDEKVVQVACGAFHSAAVTEAGSVYIWGKEDYGMLGVGQTSDVQVPQKIELFETMPALRVSCGGWHTVVVTKSGDCYSFGRGEYGRLGLGDTRSRYKPQKVEALKDKVVVQAACGGSHTLFLTKDGVAYSSGRADHGRLGAVDMKTILVPQPLHLGSLPVRQVSAGGAHSVALLHSSRGILSPLLTPLSSTQEVPHKSL